MKASYVKRIGRALGVASLLALGAAGAQGPDQYLSLRTPDAALTARVTGDSVVGPDLSLARDHKTLRGRAFGRVVFLGLNGNEVGGTVGGELSRLSFENKGNVLEAQGSFAGNLSRLTLSTTGLSGTVGPCSYELEATEDGGYRGSRSCGGVPERPVVLAIPPALAQQGPAMTLATLALILSER
jgi:hypothetical protein